MNDKQHQEQTELEVIELIALDNVMGGGPCSSDPGSPLPPCQGSGGGGD